MSPHRVSSTGIARGRVQVAGCSLARMIALRAVLDRKRFALSGVKLSGNADQIGRLHSMANDRSRPIFVDFLLTLAVSRPP